MRYLCVFTFFLLSVLAVPVTFGQGINTAANADDWEEINFVQGSDILVDDFPSLLRLADLLSRHPDYTVRVVGHGDGTGSNDAAEKLGMRRANAIRDYLIKYGARPNQVIPSSAGNSDPKTPGRTQEERFMNRRATLDVRDGQNQPVPACPCDELQDELNNLQKQLSELRDQANRTQQELDRLRNQNKQLQEQSDQARKDAEAAKQAAAAKPAPPPPAPPPPPPAPAPPAVPTFPRFSLLGVNAGVDDRGDLTMTGSGRFFAPFDRHHAAQIQGEYMYFRDRREAQADIGLVNRLGPVQMGGFASFRNIWMENMQSTGTLGQATFLADYLFGIGKVGLYGSKTFLNDVVINRAGLGTGTAVLETYLHGVDQLGASTAVAFGRSARSPWVEGDLGYSWASDGIKKGGGTARLIFPISDMIAFTAEGGVNQTLLTSANNGRAVFGILFGRQTHPNQFRATDHPIPMTVPRIRYEVGTRRVGNGAPVADAGPNQIGIEPGTVQLDGSGSSDPEDDPLTFAWTQVAGPSVGLSSPSSAQTSFAAESGQTYVFRLIVADPEGLQGTASTTVSTRVAPGGGGGPSFTSCQASPVTIARGQTSTLSWESSDADGVEIPGVGEFGATGSTTVSPTVSTTYTLIARNGAGERTCSVTVLVEDGPTPIIVQFTANPMEIGEGASSTLSWQVTGADTVTIDNGVGSVNASGTASVTPSTTTTYTLTATNRFGQAMSSTTVTVFPRVSIVSFTVNPETITAPFQAITLAWQTENALSVSISGPIGSRAVNGSLTLAGPSDTTTYILTATGAGVNNVATATVTVTLDEPEEPNNPPQLGGALGTVYTIQRNVVLNAGPWFDPEGEDLTFAWTSLDGKATIANANQQIAQALLEDANLGEFLFQVTVTDTQGQSSSAQLRVILVGYSPAQ